MDYTVLLGDDIELRDHDWMPVVHATFAELQQRLHLPEGFGCVCLNDESFPGFPSFPVLGRCHWDAFGDRMFPPEFVNQVP